MLEHLPWIAGALVIGLFVGYAFGKYRGASEAAEEPVLDERQPRKAGGDSSQADAEAMKTVYIRRGGGSHYHKEGCRHLRGRGHPVTRAAAAKKGYKPCPSCRP